jgi:hypothetical protein
VDFGFETEDHVHRIRRIISLRDAAAAKALSASEKKAKKAGRAR